MASVSVRYIVNDVDAAIEFYRARRRPGLRGSGLRVWHSALDPHDEA